MSFWEQFNHMERVLTALAALLAFVFTAIFLYFAVDFTIRIIEDPDGWQRLFLIPFTCLFAAYGSGYLGYRYWQRSKNTHCAAWGCDSPTASLKDNLCAECLKKREQGASNDTAAAPPTPLTTKTENPEPPTPTIEENQQPPEVVAKEVAETQKPSPPKCIGCQKPRTEKPEGGFHWWCFDCWGKRKDEAENSGKLPQCHTDGCAEIVKHILNPWCLECYQYKKERDRDPIKTVDGHLVKSDPERRIANFLYQNGIRYEYEKPLGTSGWLCDFYLPTNNGGGVYIEYFGLMTHQTKGENYSQKTNRKLDYYTKNQLALIQLYPEHEEHLEKHLAEELRNGKYNTIIQTN